MNTRLFKKYIWLLLAVLLPCGFMACSDSDEPLKPVENPNGGNEDSKEAYQDENAYANFFAYNVMSDVYLWNQDITAALNAWTILGDPVETVTNARYKENGKDVDKWTQMTKDYSSMVGGTDGVSNGTYGMGMKLYRKAENSETVVAFITYTYPDSPAREAGLERGDVILEIDGEELSMSNYTGLYYNASLKLGVGTYQGDGLYSDVEKTVSMTAVAMYEDPIVLTKVFDCGGKKVGYLLYTSFTFESSLGLYEVCKEFKKEGIRTSIFIDPKPEMAEAAALCGCDRVELYTEPYADLFPTDPAAAVAPFKATAERVRECGLGLNAGHDLNLFNLEYFIRNIPWTDEVSIGHAIISDALYMGLEQTIKAYLSKVKIF